MRNRGTIAKRLLLFIAGMCAISSAVVAVHFLSPAVPGPAGDVHEMIQKRGIEASALFYSEACPMFEYLGPQGRYSILNQ